jgi:hypothetical protein
VPGISQQTVRELLNIFAADWTVRSIEDQFIDAGIRPAPEPKVTAESGARRQAARRYIASLDLSIAQDSERLLPIFDNVLGDLKDWQGRINPVLERLLRRLQADGYDRGPDGKLRASAVMSVPPLKAPAGIDESILRQHLRRLEQSVVDDPAAAIGESKDLLESACKLVLARMNIEFDPKADVPALVKLALKELKLHPDALAPTTPAADAVRRILGALSTIAVGVAELRNAVGTGHGRSTYLALNSRHAHLAVGSATTFVRMLLETLEDPQAPWRDTSHP